MLILPYIEGQHIYDRYDFNEPWDGPKNRQLAGEMPRLFAFHNRYEKGQTTTNYVAVVGPATMWPGADGRKSADVTDGLSPTVLIAENRGLGVHWMEPRDLDFGTMPLDFNHPLGVSSWYKAPAVVMGDGSVRRIGPGTTPAALRAMLTANGGEKLDQRDGDWQVLPDGRQRE